MYGFYVGDGLYGDGNDFVFNYYNSYVIHPMLLDILLYIQNIDNDMIKECLDLEMKRYVRYCCSVSAVFALFNKWDKVAGETYPWTNPSPIV